MAEYTLPPRRRTSPQAAQSFAFSAAVKAGWIPLRPEPRRRPAIVIPIAPYLRLEREVDR
jgi:hypothetical protein